MRVLDFYSLNFPDEVAGKRKVTKQDDFVFPTFAHSHPPSHLSGLIPRKPGK